ncbi:MAG: hypothetical protein LC126_20425 [Bryobacterales bacterium]|nr:hypothetical protein [Bryobacterales bacterium]
MNPGNHHPRDADNTREMIGGYASGNLSPQEQEKLFDAALHDQHLFDALMDEQALKDLLDQPGVKAELLEALGPKPTRWSRLRHWLTSPAAYAAAGALATAVVLIVVTVRQPASRRPQYQRPASPPAAADREAAVVVKPNAAPPDAALNALSKPQATIPQSKPMQSPRQAEPPLDQLSGKQEQAARRDDTQQSPSANAPAGGVVGGVIGGVAPAPAPPVPEQPLSFSYTLLRRDPEGRYSPVTTPTFTPADSLRFEVTPNTDGALSLYIRNEAGLETPVLKGLPLSRGQTAAVPPSGSFSAAAGSTQLVLVFRRRQTASDSRELAPQAFRQRVRGAVEKDRAEPPAAAVGAPSSRVSAPSPAAREVSVEIAIRAGAN